MVIYVRSSPIPFTFPYFGLIKTVNNQSLCVCVGENERRAERGCVGRHNFFEMSQWRNIPITCREIKCTHYDFDKTREKIKVFYERKGKRE